MYYMPQGRACRLGTSAASAIARVGACAPPSAAPGACMIRLDPAPRFGGWRVALRLASGVARRAAARRYRWGWLAIPIIPYLRCLLDRGALERSTGES